MIGEFSARGKSTNGIRKGRSGPRNPAARGKSCEWVRGDEGDMSWEQKPFPRALFLFMDLFKF